VYALGNQIPLPGGQVQWMVCEALLKILVQNECLDIKHIMMDSTLVHKENVPCGSFPKLRLLLPFKQHECYVGGALCRQLVRFPPHELRWMKCVPREKLELLVNLMSDREYRHADEHIESFQLFEENRNDILAAQGFIAYGLLFHALYS